jgi:hypothetical protein
MDPVPGVATNAPSDGSKYYSLDWWITESSKSVDAVVVEDSSGKRCVFNYAPGATGGVDLKPPTNKAIADYDICADDYDPPPPNTAPTVEISSDPEGTIPGGTEVTFMGSASDVEDPDLTGDQLQWSSSLDGFLDSAGGSVFTVSDLSTGLHTITAQVADSDGLIGWASIELEITAVVAQQCEAFDGGVLINGVAVTCPDEITEPRLVCSADLATDADKFELGVAACCLCNATAVQCDENLAAGDPPNPITGLEPCPDDAENANPDAVQVPTTLMFNNDPYYCITVGGRRTCYKY